MEMVIKVGMIGAGFVFHHHARGWLTHSDAEIAAVCDVVKARAKKKAGDLGVKKTYTSYDELVKDPEINAVDILLPHYLHADCAIKAAEAGKHVVLTKPFAMSTKECDGIIGAAKKAGVKLMYMENYMYFPHLEKAKELIMNGEIGKPSFIRMEHSCGFGGVSKDFVEDFLKAGFDSPRIPGSWWLSRRKVGGASNGILDDGPHFFSVARWLMSIDEKARNEIKSVFAYMDLKNERPAAIEWEHENGGYGNLSFTMSETPVKLVEAHGRYGSEHETFQIIGTKGIIWATGCEGRMLGEPPVIFYDGAEGKRVLFEDINDDSSDSFVRAIHHFIDCMINDKEPKTTGEDGKKAVEVCLAAHKSARERRAVRVGTVHNLPF